MIKEIKELKTEQLSNRLNQIEQELEAITQKRSQNFLIVSKKLNIFQRIFRTAKFKRQQEAKNEEKNLESMTSERLDEKNGLEEELQELRDKNTLEDLGLTVKQAIELLEKHHIPVILEDIQQDLSSSEYTEELVNQLKGKEIQTVNDFVLVHKTDFPPSDNRIKTTKHSNGKLQSSVTLNDEEYDFDYLSDRNTIHFSVNHEVTANTGGSWDECRYAVVLPFNQIPRDQMRGILSTDTFVEDDVKLNEEAYILCPAEEIKTIQQKNPNVNIVGYNGENVLNYANSLIAALGYKLESGGFYEWSNEKDKEKFNEIIEEQGLENLRGSHSGSLAQRKERLGNALNKCNAIVSLAKKKQLFSSSNREEIHTILKDILDNSYPWENLDMEIREFLSSKGIDLEEANLKSIQEGKISLCDEICHTIVQGLDGKDCGRNFSTNEIGKNTVPYSTTDKKDEVMAVENTIRNREEMLKEGGEYGSK